MSNTPARICRGKTLFSILEFNMVYSCIRCEAPNKVSPTTATTSAATTNITTTTTTTASFMTTTTTTTNITTITTTTTAGDAR